MQQIIDKLIHNMDVWAIVGFVAQLAFTGRFLVQWIASERSRKSVIPTSFWYLSLIGSFGLLVYAIVRADPVFILGQAFGSIVYIRNLMLIAGHQKTQQQPAA